MDVLLLVNTDPERKAINEMMAKADIIYVGEGNTLKMMKYWQKISFLPAIAVFAVTK